MIGAPRRSRSLAGGGRRARRRAIASSRCVTVAPEIVTVADPFRVTVEHARAAGRDDRLSRRRPTARRRCRRSIPPSSQRAPTARRPDRATRDYRAAAWDDRRAAGPRSPVDRRCTAPTRRRVPLAAGGVRAQRAPRRHRAARAAPPRSTSIRPRALRWPWLARGGARCSARRAPLAAAPRAGARSRPPPSALATAEGALAAHRGARPARGRRAGRYVRSDVGRAARLSRARGARRRRARTPPASSSPRCAGRALPVDRVARAARRRRPDPVRAAHA